MPHNVIPLHTEEEEQPQDLAALLEVEYVKLLRDMNDPSRLRPQKNPDTEDGEGTGGSPLSIAERVKVLSSATEFLLKLQKIRPREKAASGVNRLLTEYRSGNTAGRTRRRRGNPDAE